MMTQPLGCCVQVEDLEDLTSSFESASFQSLRPSGAINEQIKDFCPFLSLIVGNPMLPIPVDKSGTLAEKDLAFIPKDCVTKEFSQIYGERNGMFIFGIKYFFFLF